MKTSLVLPSRAEVLPLPSARPTIDITPKLTAEGLPIVVADGRTDDERGDMLFVSAWSAGMEAPYQRTRIQTLAAALGRRIFAPNTPGQGEGSRQLTKAERGELREGRVRLIGKSAIDAVFEDMDGLPPKLDIVAVSQGPLMVPGVIHALADRGIEVGSVSLVTPASTRTGSTLDLMKGMVGNSAKFMKEYRAENPEYLKTAKDTNIVRSLLTQFRAHVIDYPRAMVSQDFSKQMAEAIARFETAPTVHVMAAEHDKVSRLEDNAKLVSDLQARGINTWLDVLEGQYHAVTEHVGHMAYLIKRAIGR